MSKNLSLALAIVLVKILLISDIFGANLYDWESRATWPECKDLVLLYGGGRQRNYDWNNEYIQPYVTYVDEQGEEHWMFDSFLFLEIRDGVQDEGGVSFATGYTDNPAKQSDWKKLVDYYFRKNFAIDAIDQAVQAAKFRIGEPETKRKIVMGIPEPIKTLTNWGTINGKAINFQNVQDRIDACVWYIDYVRQKFDEANLQNVELAGFYWIHEAATRTIETTIGAYLNSLKYSFIWIPYFRSPGWYDWRVLGFNYAYLQPNYFFKEPLIENRLDEACYDALSNQMDMELEFDERILTRQSAWHQRLENYIQAFENYGIWENKRIAYYHGSRALYLLSISTDAADQAIYHKFCKKVAARSNKKKVDATTNWSFSDANVPPNSPLLPGTSTPLISSAVSTTRNLAVGQFNGQDRVCVFTRAGDNRVKLLLYDTATGNYMDSLRTGGAMAPNGVGNLVSIGDGDFTEDGVLLLSNVAGGAQQDFKVYKWDKVNQTAAEVAISYNLSSKFPTARFGDKIYVKGNYSEGTARVYATNKIRGYANVVYWAMKPEPGKPGKYIFEQEPVEAFEVYAKNIQSSICMNDEGEYYYKESEMPMVKYSISGDSIGASTQFAVRSWGTSVKFVAKDGEDDILAYFKYRSKATNPIEAVQERVDLLRVPNGNLNEAQVIATTPSLGAEYNLNGWGDVFARKKNKDVEIFVLSATNGFGKYTVKDVFQSTDIGTAVRDTFLLKKHHNTLYVDGVITPQIMRLYNISGQLIKEDHNTYNINVEGVHGVYILQIILKSNQVQSYKVVL